MNNQRRARKKDKLSTERVQKLDDIGFEWSLQSPQGTPPKGRQIQSKRSAVMHRAIETGNSALSLESSSPPKNGEECSREQGNRLSKRAAIGGKVGGDSTNSSPSKRARGSSNTNNHDIRSRNSGLSKRALIGDLSRGNGSSLDSDNRNSEKQQEGAKTTQQHDLDNNVETLTAELSKARSQLDRLKQQYDGVTSMIGTLTAQNASLVEQIAAAKQSLGANAAELKSVSQQLNNAVVQLESLKNTLVEGQHKA